MLPEPLTTQITVCIFVSNVCADSHVYVMYRIFDHSASARVLTFVLTRPT